MSKHKLWEPQTPDHYSLTDGINFYTKNFHLIMETLSDDPERRAIQMKGLYNPKWASLPDVLPLDVFDRPILLGDLVMVINKQDRTPLRVVGYTKTYLILEDVKRGGRTRQRYGNIMVIEDQLIANARRKRITKELQKLEMVTNQSRHVELKVTI